MLRAAPIVPILVLFVVATLFHGMTWAQASSRTGAAEGAGGLQPDSFEPRNQPYLPPTDKERLRRYGNWMFSPYSMASVTFVSGLHQAERNPTDWEEGWAGFGERYASNLGTEMTNATARYALAQAFHEDTLYYPCECRGIWPRFRHAVFATFVARRGADGHAAFGVPELAAPYAGPIVSVYAWYPHRYGIEDAFRMGNHGVLSEAGTNVAVEFLPSILHRWGRRWEKRLHLGIPSGAAGGR